jgi:endogenous inhibitor of DNA gyrase (YacG/DUF329 family)
MRKASQTAICPVCGKPAAEATRPFCGKRCADVDLGRWLTGQYRIPGPDAEPDADPPASPPDAA